MRVSLPILPSDRNAPGDLQLGVVASQEREHTGSYIARGGTREWEQRRRSNHLPSLRPVGHALYQPLVPRVIDSDRFL